MKKWTAEYRNDQQEELNFAGYSSGVRPRKLTARLILLLLLFFVDAFGQSPVAYLHTRPRSESAMILPGRPANSIPFELLHGMIVLPAQIDRQPGQFILDTGAPLMVINDLPEKPTRRAASINQELEVGDTTIEAFHWAGAEEKHLDALVLDISHLESAFDRPISGLIGYNVLKHYEVFFNYEDRFLLRYNARKNVLHRTAKPRYSISFQLFDHLPVITVQIGNRKLRLGLDTGACANLIDPAALAALDASYTTALPEEDVQGLDQNINRVQAVLLDEIAVRGLVVPDLRFLVTDMPVLHSEHGGHLDGLLGYSFLSRMKFSINYAKQKIYVWE